MNSFERAIILALFDIFILMISFKKIDNRETRRVIISMVIISYIASTFDIWEILF